MKNRMKTALPIALVFAAAVVATTTTACTNPVLTAMTAMTAKDFGLVGNWKNTNMAYQSTYQPPQAYIFNLNSNGTFRCTDISGGYVTSDGTYTIGSAVTEGDTRTFTVRLQWSAGTMSVYALVRWTAPATLELNAGATYPTSINPLDPYNPYAKYTLQ